METEGRWDAGEEDWSARAEVDFSYCLFLNKTDVNEAKEAALKAAIEKRAAEARLDVKSIPVEDCSARASTASCFRAPPGSTVPPSGLRPVRQRRLLRATSGSTGPPSQGDAWFGSATFQGYAWFDSATFSGDSWFGSATFSGETRFVRATFSGTASFSSTTFSGTASFDSAAFRGAASLTRCLFGHRLVRQRHLLGRHLLRQRHLPGDALFRGLTFPKDVFFNASKFRAGPSRFRPRDLRARRHSSIGPHSQARRISTPSPVSAPSACRARNSKASPTSFRRISRKRRASIMSWSTPTRNSELSEFRTWRSTCSRAGGHSSGLLFRRTTRTAS